jgi:hypothetical protein
MEEQALIAKDQRVICAFVRPMVVSRVECKQNILNPERLVALTKRFILYVCFAFGAFAIVLSWRYSAWATEAISSDGAVLLSKYPAIKTNLEANQYGIPLYLESKEESSSLHVDLYGILNYPFDNISKELRSPGNWCDISSLLSNIKASIFRRVSSQWLLTLYSGRKYYQAPKDAYQLDFNFRIASLQHDYLDLALTAENGPMFTKDHRIRFEAAAMDKVRTFIHFSYDYTYGAFARMAMKTYYETLGSGKKGFTVTAAGKNGDPVYIGGVRGSEERNAVRYYLAIQTYMDTLNIPEDQKFEKRINHWYDLTERFPLQLYEMDKTEYLTDKRREHANQLLLQKEADK